MKKFYFLLFFCLFTLGFGQSVQLYNPADKVDYLADQYFCVGEKFNLQVDAVSSSTGDYAMTSVFPTDFGLSAGSTPIVFPAAGADKFSEAFPIGFNFSFYGKTYSKVVLGSNGRLVFTNDPELENLKNNTVYTDRTFSGVPAYNTYSKLPSADYNKVYKANPAQELNLAQIFFGYTDLVPRSVNGSVTYLYKSVVISGVNGLMVSFQNQIRTNGTGGISTVPYLSYVLLLEDGRVIIYVNNKSEINYNAILGMQNDDGTKEKVPKHSNTAYDYNNGPWKSEGKAWLFTPNQNLTPVFKWFRNGSLITGETSAALNNFTPNDNDVLKVEVSYINPDTGAQIGAVVSDEVQFKSLKTPQINIITSTCAQIDLETPFIPDVTYEWRKVGNATVLSTTNKLSVTSTGDYIVKIIRNGSAGLCSLDSAPISLVLNSTFPPFNNSPKIICKTDGSTQATVNLYDYYPADPTQYTLRFQENGVDLPSPNNVLTLNADQTRTIKIDAESLNTTASCSFTATFDLTFISLPVTNTEYSPTNLCFGSNTYNLLAFENQYFAGKNYQFTYSVNGGTSYQTLTSVNPQVNNPVLVKIKHPNSTCETVVKLKFNFNTKVIANTPVTQLPSQCASSTQTFDLASLIPEINPDPNVTITFHTNLQNAIDGGGAVTYNFRSGMGYTTLYIRVVDNVTGCVSPDHPDFTVLVYPRPNLLLTSISKANCTGDTIFSLTQNPNVLTDAQLPVTVALEYYSSNGTLLTPSQIANYDASVFGQNPYIKVNYNPTCNGTVTFNLTYNPKPVSIKSQILICAEVNYSLQNFKNEVIANPANYTFTDLSNNPLPASFSLSSLPLTVNYLMKDNTTGCISDPQTLTFTQGGSSALSATETDYTLCDTDFDGITPFNLDSKKSIFTTDASANFEYFKDLNLTQSISSNYTNETAFAQTIFVRITLPNFCPSTAKINLKVNIPNKSTTLQPEYFICSGETLVIDAGTENTIFTWSDGKGTGQTASFTKPGNYSVVLQKGINGCPYTHNFTISDINQPKIQVINQTNNSIEVIAEGGSKPYTYYFNGVPQSSNILLNPTQSSYEIQVKSNTGCLGPPKMVYFIKINNAFSPNEDGINDVWCIENLDKMQQVSIVIVNRNGTTVFESNNPSKSEWDGKQNGRELPTSSYWYVISWFDGVTQKTEQRQGWILLKNRN
ncbi:MULTISPECIES: gliding motility-associated C-terminal domain-containing protein [unclassified Kaistella]|uniref:T9SS type B sorting domain-containing protein n=1 Tax=unclassified Kaistella TaxID=2762626 RepID=UPI00273740BD|nr:MULTISPECIES: gliding motility-associated C-terminal domain-containing protein [unclassified Kaistella]MDP2453144.1 gliding motility-associated C-terminal domain-containing protein [Kaistella sp. SH11-4b]MDP2456201.1 gliding motility-associated C-terminal domain-containing protein [Kaistella sp. SH40-3]MDP2458957.1 gliding motility-associated C-terminal domain-containing protein [Kaistella sp. SH19-2b]